MAKRKRLNVGLTFGEAVLELSAKNELWRAGWSRDPQAENWHQALRRSSDARLMSVDQAGLHWDCPSLKLDDVRAEDWEVWTI